MADLIERDALEPFYESGTDPKDPYADMTFIRAEHIINAPAVTRWIPCSERMPEIFDFVIGAGSDGIGIVRYNGTFFVDDSGATYTLNAITHWMPLPEPPEASECNR